MSVILISSDKHEFSVSKKSINKYIEDQLELEGGNKVTFIDINGETLKKVAEYLEHYDGSNPEAIPQTLKSNDLANDIKDKWAVDFINSVNFESAFHLINAGSLLQLDHLHDLACAKIASFMKDKSPEDVNKEFTIECQLTADEAKELGLETDNPEG